MYKYLCMYINDVLYYQYLRLTTDSSILFYFYLQDQLDFIFIILIMIIIIKYYIHIYSCLLFLQLFFFFFSFLYILALALIMVTNSGLSEAPPTKNPSTSGSVAKVAALPAVTDPPYMIRVASATCSFTFVFNHPRIS
jgi:hypothetical protein